MALLGTKVKMKGFTKYRAQLDNKSEFVYGLQEIITNEWLMQFLSQSC